MSYNLELTGLEEIKNKFLLASDKLQAYTDACEYMRAHNLIGQFESFPTPKLPSLLSFVCSTIDAELESVSSLVPMPSFLSELGNSILYKKGLSAEKEEEIANKIYDLAAEVVSKNSNYLSFISNPENRHLVLTLSMPSTGIVGAFKCREDIYKCLEGNTSSIKTESRHMENILIHTGINVTQDRLEEAFQMASNEGSANIEGINLRALKSSFKVSLPKDAYTSMSSLSLLYEDALNAISNIKHGFESQFSSSFL